MADNETTTVINAVDNTGTAIRSAIRGMGDLERNLAAVSRRTGQAISPEEWKRRGDAFMNSSKKMVDGLHEQTEAVQESAAAHGKHHAVIHEVSEELVGIASKWIGIAAAIDKAKEGFVDFAKDEETVRIIGARLGATHEQLEKFKESAEKMEGIFGTSFEKAAMTMEAFRKAAGLTVAQLRDVERVGPGIMEVAHRFGVDSVAMAETFGTFVRQMKIDPAQYEQALGEMGIAAQRLKLDFNQLNRTAPQLADSMAELGLKGVGGLSQMLAVLSMTRKEFGNMRSASGQLQSALSQVQSGGGVAAAFGMDAAQWSENTDMIVEKGGNVFDYYIEKIKEARQEGYSWGELFNDPKQRRFWKMMVEDGSKYRELQEKIAAESKDFHAGSTKDFENDAMALARLSQSLNELVKSFGGFMSAIGTADALRSLTKDLHDIISLVTKITELTNHFSWGKLAEMLPSVKDLRMPTLASISQGILHGPMGDPKLHKNKYSLEMNDEENPERHAIGGRTKAGRTYMVGENGPELFRSDSSGSITTNDTIKNVERHTDDTNTILTQIRDILYKDQQDNGGGGSGGGSGGSDVGESGSIGGGAGANPMGELGSSGDGTGGGRVRGLTRGLARSLNAEGQGVAATDTSNLHGSEYLVKERSGMKAEIDADPNLRRELRGMMSTEGTPLGSLESLANRTAYINAKRAKQGKKPLSLRQMLHSGFYGPINHGKLPGAMRATDRHPGTYDAAIDAVFDKGSNILEGATDQGMPSDPNGQTAIGGFRKKMGGNVFNDWGGGGSPMDAARWRIEQQKKVNSSQPTTPAESVPMPQPKPQQVDPSTPMSSLEEARKLRAELEQPITIRTQLDRGSDSQFRRASMRREVNREVREASWSSYADIGSA